MNQHQFFVRAGAQQSAQGVDQIVLGKDLIVFQQSVYAQQQIGWADVILKLLTGTEHATTPE
ncbi:MAG: hypothetical protein MOB07_30600 [Acidobacteria bacterium]|nr:hypothetical protein [Acidobacteriota bacterium]